MDSLCFPLSPDGPTLDVLIGLNDQDSAALLLSGRSIRAPLRLRALIDCGTDVTAVAPRVFQQLGLLSAARATSYTAGGQPKVRLFNISLSISGPLGTAGPMLHREDMLVSELAVTLPNVEVLIGMDILKQCLFILDGPGRQFTLAF